MVIEHDAGIVTSTHGPLQKCVTYLDNFILESHINNCDMGFFLPISSHESKITLYLSKMSYCTQNCYAALCLPAVVWWKQVPWYCSHRWPYCTSSWWQV